MGVRAELLQRLLPLLQFDPRPLRSRLADVVPDLAAALGAAGVLARVTTDPRRLDVVAVAHPEAGGAEMLASALADEELLDDPRLLAPVLRGEPLLVTDLGPEPGGSVHPAFAPLLRRHPMGSVVAAPVRVRGDVAGVLLFARARGEPAFTEADRDDVAGIADRLALVVREATAELNTAALDAALNGIVVIDEEGRIAQFNPAAERMFGRSRSDVALAEATRLLIPEPLRGAFEAGLRRGGRMVTEGLRADGTTFPMDVTVAQMSQDPPRYATFLWDVTEGRRAEAERLERAQRQGLVLSLGSRALAGADPRLLAREALLTIALELEPDRGVAVATRPDGTLERLAAVEDGAVIDDPGLVDEVEERLCRRALTLQRPEILSGEAAGAPAGSVLLVPVIGDGESTAGAAILFAERRDAFTAADAAFVQLVANVAAMAVDRGRAQERLAALAVHDVLTDLPNRALLDDRLTQVLERGARRRRPTALLVLDIDGFRALNDRHGHATGDQALRAVARRLTRALGPDATVARVGADEFAVIAPPEHGEREARELAERLGAVVAEPLLAGGHELWLSVSTGIALAEPGDVDAEGLLRAAEDAQMRARARGRARVEVLTPAMRGRAAQRLELEQELRRALRDGEFVLHFQPVVALADGALVAFEALLRWQHPERGLLTPGQFLDAAEASGLMVELGGRILEEACRTIARWRAELDGEAVPVHVNLSAQQLAEPRFVEEVMETLERTAVEPQAVILELTETLLEDDRADTLEDLRRLCDHGVRIALDDFGTGYASLERLKRLPFDELKLDQSFVAGLPSNRRDASLVEAMVRMGRSLGLTVVAEGVETAEQVGFMRRLACDQAQGFHFSRPVSAPAALALLRRRRRWNVAVGGQGPGRPPAEEDELLTLSQAATALGVSTTTTRRWANSGELASTRTSGGHRRFPASEVRRLRSRRHRPSVRVGEPPREPLPALAKVAETLGPRLTQAAWRELYDDTPGFFGDPDAEEAHVRWLDAIASAAQTGNYAMLREATETFMEEARRRGAPLLERHAALERFAAVAARALGRAGAPHTDVVAARRLFAFLQQRHLAASE